MCGCLKINLRSKPGNDSTPSNAAHIGIILNNRLDQERSVIQQYVQLDAVLGLPGNHARREEIRTQIVSHIAQRYGVVKTPRGRALFRCTLRRNVQLPFGIWRGPASLAAPFRPTR